jgi:quinol monooxygenase YgiN
MINLFVHLHARPGKRQELLQAIGELKNKIASETGCVDCQVYQNPENPRDFVIFEQWENEEQASAHASSENMAVLVGAGSVLTRIIDVTLSKDPATTTIEQVFKKRLLKKDADDHGISEY